MNTDNHLDPGLDDVGRKTPETEAEPATEDAPAATAATPRSRMVLWTTLALVVVVVGSAMWLASGRSLLGLQSGQGAMSFLPVRLPEGVVLEVNDQQVTRKEFNERTQLLESVYGVQRPEGPTAEDYRRDVAKSYAVSLILQRAAGEHGVEVSDQRAEQTLTSFIQEQVGEGPEAYQRFVDVLGAAGVTQDMVVAEVRRQLLLGGLFTEITKNHREVTEQQVREAYQDRREELTTPQTRTLRNIVVSSRREAARLLRELEAGASFSALARQSSLDGSTRAKGGVLGRLAQDSLEPEYGKAAFAAGEGELYGPVRNEFGWNIGRVDQVVPARTATFDEVRDELETQLQQEQVLEVWRDWLADQIEQADVVYVDEYRPAHPDSPPGLGSLSPRDPGSGPGPLRRPEGSGGR
jgi:peptidyl-prolyl cis-trans isomerase C